MKVLRYGNRKEPDWFLDASTPEKEASALRCLFLHLKHNWNAYVDMEHIDADIAELEKELVKLRELKEQLPTLHELVREEAEKRIEQGERSLRDLQWQKSQWEKVKAGDIKALKRFLESRSSWEYEEWEFVDLDDPDEYIKKHFEGKT